MLCSTSSTRATCGLRKARSLDDAILLVGLEATRHIILGIVIHALFPKSQVVESFDQAAFCATA